MTWLNKLPDSHRHPPGLEWRLLRRMPRIFLIGTLLPILAVLAARVVPLSGDPAEVAAAQTWVEIYAISAVVLHWTVVLTLSIGCFIVMVMKGPAYVADAYPLPDAEHPGGDPYPADRSRHGTR
jgi:hypothetical protein